jgi:hypothetical protein
MNHAELIARLRYTASKGVSIWAEVQYEAADALERQNAELAALKAEKAEREKQDYAAYVNDEGFIVERDLSISPGEKLYLAPGAGSVPMTDAETYLKQIDGAASRDWLIGWDDCVAHNTIGVKP